MIVNAKPSGILSLGRTGENQARSIRFDISHWVRDFGPGVVELVHQRSGDPYPYPVVVSQDGNEVTWNITATDTDAAGSGRAELQYYVGDTLAKSETWVTKVFPALGPAAETPPEPQQGWVDQVLQAGAEAKEAADRAEEAAVRQPYPNAETGTWWVWDSESDAYTDTGISYGTGDSGTSDHDKLTGRDKTDQHPMSAITGLEDALAGKQPTGSYLTKETDPTVPDWAKAETKPSYTAAEVGADPSGTAASLVTAHNTEATAHSDMRIMIKGLTDRLNALADSDDTTLDQLSEIVAYIKSNRDLISAITTDKVSVGDIVNDLVTNVANKPLSAAQGVALKALIDALDAAAVGAIPAPVTATVGQTIRVSAVDETGKPTEWEAVDIVSGGGAPYQQLVTDGTGKATWEDRLCYIDSEFRELLPLSTLVFEDSGNGLYLCSYESSAFSSLTSGNDASIMFDGQQYNLTTKELFGSLILGNAGILGLADTGEPFVVILLQEGIKILTLLTATSHAVSISAQVTEKKLLAKEYLSEDIAVFTKRQESTGMPESITWDGDITGRATCRWNAIDYYKISDLLPTRDCLIYQTMILQNGKEEIQYESDFRIGDGYLTANKLAVFSKTGTVNIVDKNYSYSVNVPETGLYVSYNNGYYIKTVNFNQTAEHTGLIVPSSNYKSSKKFFLSVDDSGTISATEVT